MESSIHIRTEDDMTNSREKLLKMDVVDHCTKEMANNNGSFTNLHFEQFFFRYSKIYTWVVKTLFYLSPSCKISLWIALLSREIRYNPTMTTWVCLKKLLYICMVTTNWKKNLQEFLIFFSLRARKEILQYFKVFNWPKWSRCSNDSKSLKRYCSCLFFCMVLISLNVNSLVNLLVKFRRLRKVSSFDVTTITLAT